MNTHFKRLERLYGRSHAASTQAAVSFGRAIIHSDIEGHLPGTTAAEQLLTDAARLAAGSLHKEHVVRVDQFEVEMKEDGYTGPVRAMAQVILTQPPRAVVTVLLLSDDDEVVAEARGSFLPTKEQLPDLSAVAEPSSSTSNDAMGYDSEYAETDAAGLKPASFMPIYASPFGVICLN
ncbi:hypothetical protein CRI93_08115 [Longimonas halophila]|uniref:Uncharacterized protein n=1 Tax=Longimonas halophila TaxID=1469170 RepID=A0A2H3NM07_9BACT|nr:hypothetical protein [Longimonas halophila]PEN07090.1 hypothetical protein CRI93_08115 [Longimonas halophila]